MRGSKRKILFGLIFFCIALGAGIAFHYYTYFSHIVCQEFEGKKWELPARVYSRAAELYPGMELSPNRLEQELRLMQYRRTAQTDHPGSYSRSGNIFEIFRRTFRFEDGEEAPKKFKIVILNGRIQSLSEADKGTFPDLVRLDPAVIGSFYPTHKEDRILVKLEAVSPLLIETLLAVEDRNFYHHYGVAPLAIARAMITNIRKRRMVQGGSTLTQQLVKNFFLTREQTLRRKIEEMFMSLALERNYEKDEILETYLNEVYLGQDGERAVHGFGLASAFYFGRSVHDLRAHEIALLVGMLKGPSAYDPRRFPDRAMQRRNTVLTIMETQNVIDAERAKAARNAPLDVIEKPGDGITKFPAFLDMVKRQLLQQYKEEDLRSEGLRIFTSFDPQIQFAAEDAAVSQLKAIESGHGLPKGKLEVSAVVTSTGGNEILALVSGRNPGFRGFNRALDAKRPIGSLIKPAVYLTALQDPEHYTLITPLDDSFLTMRLGNQTWTPENYDRQYHGSVPLYAALVHSYNIATVRLGTDIGLEKIHETLRQMGFNGEFHPYPSSLLGTPEMSAYEVAQMYQIFASGGFFSPIRAIRSVYTRTNIPLQRYPLTIRQNFDPRAVYLLNKVLQSVVIEGTGKSLKYIFPQDFGAAGKTGTSNDLKDSWFAGFTGDRLAVVWMGRDDNQSCGLTGASGALQVWGKIMANIRPTPLELPQPEGVEWVTVDALTGMRAEASTENPVSVPFIAGSAPPGADEDTPSSKTSLIRWLKELFQ
jgi:penicillin-binding protein 1B